tara:strand:+ start:1963 stop:2958 length:996 start_codon:yes stop_codon:yes gene_type:complete
MNIIVTGGAGFIGSNLIRRLLKEGHKVISLDNYSTGLQENEIDDPNVSYFNVDITNVKDYSYFRKKPDIVYHLAALPRIQPSFDDPVTTVDVNVMGTTNILEWVRKINKNSHKCPIVYAGTSSIHGDRFANPYTLTKGLGEEMVQMYNKLFDVPSAICRFYNVYGLNQTMDGEYRTVVAIFESQYGLKQPLTVTGDGEQRRDFTHVFDIVDGFYKAGKSLLIPNEFHAKVNGEIFELGTGKNYSINEITEMFGEEEVEYIPARPGEMRETLCTDTKAKELLGWKANIDIKDYISDLVWRCKHCGEDTSKVEYDYIGTDTNHLKCELENETD